MLTFCINLLYYSSGKNAQTEPSPTQQSYQPNSYQASNSPSLQQNPYSQQQQQQQYNPSVAVPSSQQYAGSTSSTYQQQSYQSNPGQQVTAAVSQQQQPYYQTQQQQPPTSVYPANQSYAAQGQQTSAYQQAGYSDQSGYQGNQAAGNPYRTMSPTSGRYPQPTQGYDYAPAVRQPVPQNAPNNSLGYAGPGW